ncbi:MAG: hypothetical protein K6D59_01750 [Bacteroidales bacterium]|nr:hypothetical protein [Bacteroidales bacterium]
MQIKENDTIWRNCTNEELLAVLDTCPEVVEELKKIGYKDLINSYDALLPIYKMDRGTSPVYKDNTDDIDYFEFWFMVDGKQYDMPEGERYTTKAKAQLASVQATMIELQKRIQAKV